MKHKYKILISFILIIFILPVFTLPAFAATNYDGGVGVGGSGSSASATGDYSVPDPWASEGDSKTVMGIRFSLYDLATGKTTNVIDVYRAGFKDIDDYLTSGRKETSKKYNHKHLADNWEDLELKFTSNLKVLLDNDIGITLPEKTNGINAWRLSDFNLTTILSKLLSTSTNITDLKKDQKLLIEPIYPLLIGGTKCNLTVAEMAVFGAKTYGADKSISANTTQGTWNFIANQTNRSLPNSLMTTDGTSGVFSKTSAIASGKWATFGTILNKGYGVSVVWNEEAQYTLTINYCSKYQNRAEGNYIKDLFGKSPYTWSTPPTENGVKIRKSSTISVTAGEFDLPDIGNSNLKVYRDGYHTTGNWYNAAYDFSSDTTTKYTPAKFAALFGKDLTKGDVSVNIYIEWEINQYTISYDANGGSGAPSSQGKTYGTDLKLSSTKPTQKGCVFVEWNTESNGKGTSYAAGGTYKNNTSVVLYAQWKPITYTIQYNANGGLGTMEDTIATYGQQNAIKDNAFTKEGHLFNGWHVYRKSDKKWLYTYNNSAAWYEKDSQPSGATLRKYNNGTIVSKSTSVDGDIITLYAQWSEAGHYCYIDGINGNDNNSGMNPANPVKTFKQAYTNIKNTGGIIYVVNTVSISSNITLTSTEYLEPDNDFSLSTKDLVSIKRYSKPTTVNDGFNVDSNLNLMIEVKENATLTIKNIDIDGHKNEQITGDDNQIAKGVSSNASILKCSPGGSVIISDAFLQNNNSSSDGGAIYNEGTISILNSTLLGNAAKNGGAVYNSGKLNISGVVSNNTALQQGGGICNKDGVLTLGIIEISNNTAYSRNGYMIQGDGGGVYSSSDLEIGKDVTISNNYGVNGGGVSVYEANLTLSGGKIINNTANDAGGVSVSYGVMNMLSGSVSDNIAGILEEEESNGQGGGINISGNNEDKGILNIKGGEIKNNKVLASDDAWACGGGIYCHWATINMEAGVVSNNASDNAGGGVFLNERATFNMTGGTIENNNAEDGGGVYVSYYWLSYANIGGSALITNNTANYGGGGIFNSGCIVTIDNDAVISNNNAKIGGGIYNDGDGTEEYGVLTINGGTIKNNDAVYGAGVYNGYYYSGSESGGLMNMTGGMIVDNVSSSTDNSCEHDNVYNQLGIINLSGGRISGTEKGIFNDDGTLNMSGGSIIAEIIGVDNYTDTAGSTINMSGGKISTAEKGIYNHEGSTINMSGETTEIINCAEYGIYQDGIFKVKDAPTIEQPVFLTPDHFVTVIGPCTSKLVIALGEADTFDGRVMVNYTFDTSGQKKNYSLSAPTKAYANTQLLMIADEFVESGSYPYRVLLRVGDYVSENMTILKGTVFDAEEEFSKFVLPTSKELDSFDVVYNGVPRDNNNIATTVGTGYTVVYKVNFTDGTTGDYRLIVTVLDEAEWLKSGYIRFISNKYLDTLEPNSKWRLSPLKSILESSLSVEKPTDDDAQEVWEFSAQDIKDIKKWVKDNENAGVSREEQNSTFISAFNHCKTK